MIYLKTFEQLEDFYKDNYNKYLIVTNDEKYVVYIGSANMFKDPMLYPVDNIINEPNKYFFDAEPIEYLDKLNNYESESKSLSDYSQMGMYSGQILPKILERDGFKLVFDEPYNKPNMYKIINYNVGYQTSKNKMLDL